MHVHPAHKITPRIIIIRKGQRRGYCLLDRAFLGTLHYDQYGKKPTHLPKYKHINTQAHTHTHLNSLLYLPWSTQNGTHPKSEAHFPSFMTFHEEGP